MVQRSSKRIPLIRNSNKRKVHMSNSIEDATGIGKQLLLELYECNGRNLRDASFVKRVIVQACIRTAVTLVETVFYQFSNGGITGAALIAESHVTVHTWPERGYAAVDVFTCGKNIDHFSIIHFLVKKFAAKRWESTFILRGVSATKTLTTRPNDLS